MDVDGQSENNAWAGADPYGDYSDAPRAAEWSRTLRQIIRAQARAQKLSDIDSQPSSMLPQTFWIIKKAAETTSARPSGPEKKKAIW